MTNEVFESVLSRIEDKYGQALASKNKALMKIPTYDISDEDADKVLAATFAKCSAPPTVNEWRLICRDFRESTRVIENKEHCFACGDEGIVFWIENYGAHSAFCPRCDMGASLQRRSPNKGFCDPRIAAAIALKNESFTKRTDAERRAVMGKYKEKVKEIETEMGRSIE